jgi:hypothetical protein
MTKLKYPSSGIYRVVSSSLDEANTCLTSSVNLADYSVPYGFSNRKYLLDLKNVLNGYVKEHSAITNQLINTSKEMDALDLDSASEIKKLDMPVVKDIDRMIV